VAEGGVIESVTFFFKFARQATAQLFSVLQEYLTCVAVSNTEGWAIPFPQLTIHQPTI